MKKLFKIVFLLLSVSALSQTGPAQTINGKVTYNYRPTGSGNTLYLTINPTTFQLEFQSAVSGIPLATPSAAGISKLYATSGSNTDGSVTQNYFTNQINLKANLFSPALVGIPTAPTAALGTNTTQVATTEFVQSSVEDANASNIYTIKNASTPNVRNDAITYVTLDNGNLLCAYSRFGADGSDVDTAYIAGKISTDGGITWGSEVTLQSNIPGDITLNTPSLYKRPDGNIGMLYIVTTDDAPPESQIYQTIYNQTLSVVTPAASLGLPSGYYSPANHAVFTVSNGDLLYPITVLTGGDGTSFGSTYVGSILKSTNNGVTWTDLNLTIGSSQTVTYSGVTFGGAAEPRIMGNSDGLICYFRTLKSATYAVKLNSSYAPTGGEYTLFPAANATSFIKWIESEKIYVAARTRLLNHKPIGDNERKFIDLLTSKDGLRWSNINQVDFAIPDFNWYINQPVIYELGDKVLVGYNNSKTGIKTASLFNKIYPKSFLKYAYDTESYIGASDNGWGGFINGVQLIDKTDGTLNTAMISYPPGGSYSSNGAIETGAFKISLPNNHDAHLTIKGFIYDNANNESLSFEITCNASDMSKNTIRISGYDLSPNMNIRFANGSIPKIFIGNLSSTWEYTSLVITEVVGSYQTSLSEISEGWKVEIESTSYGTVVSTKNHVDNAIINGGTLILKNAPTSINFKSSRGDENKGYAIGHRLNTNGAIISNCAQDMIFYEIHDNGKISFGNTTEPANGKYSFDGEVEGVAATFSTSLIPKGQVDTALALKANIASPTFTGVPAAPTATAGTNTTQLATTAFVQTALTNNFINALDTTLAVTATSTSLTVPGTWGSGAHNNGNLTIYANATSNAVNINLPTAASMVGRTVNIIKTDASANAITVNGSGTNINGATTYLLSTQYQNVTVRSNGTQFYIF